HFLDRIAVPVDQHHYEPILRLELGKQSLGDLGSVPLALKRQMPCPRRLQHLQFQPAILFLRLMGSLLLAPPLLRPQLVITGVNRDSCDPGFKRAPPREGRQRKIGLGEYFLGDVFNLVAAPEKTADNSEYPWAVAAHQLFERVVIGFKTTLY